MKKIFSITSSAAELFFVTIIEDDGTIPLAKYTGTEEKVVIPRTIVERKVTTIGACCFEDNKIDSVDASKILEYYAAVSTGKNPAWD